MKPAISGGVNWPPSSYDPASGYLYVCAQDRIGTFRAEAIDDRPPPPGERYAAGIFGGSPLAEARRVRGDGHADEQDRLAAALARGVLQRLDRRPRAASCSSAATTAGSRRSNSARRHEALGVPDRRGHELARDGVRARRQAIRRRVLRGQSVRGLAEGRQRLAVRARRHARSRAARGRRDDVHARSGRHGGSRRRQDGLRDRVHVSVTASKAKAVTAAANRSSTRAARTS